MQGNPHPTNPYSKVTWLGILGRCFDSFDAESGGGQGWRTWRREQFLVVVAIGVEAVEGR